MNVLFVFLIVYRGDCKTKTKNENSKTKKKQNTFFYTSVFTRMARTFKDFLFRFEIPDEQSRLISSQSSTRELFTCSRFNKWPVLLDPVSFTAWIASSPFSSGTHFRYFDVPVPAPNTLIFRI